MSAQIEDHLWLGGKRPILLLLLLLLVALTALTASRSRVAQVQTLLAQIQPLITGAAKIKSIHAAEVEPCVGKTHILWSESQIKLFKRTQRAGDCVEGRFKVGKAW